MKSNRMFMGAAVIGCLAAAMTSGAAAQVRDHMNGHQNARAGGNHMGATAQLNGTARRGGSHFTNGNRMGETATRDRREFVEGRTVGGERRSGRVAAETPYGEWRANRREFGGAASAGEYDRAWRGDRFGYRDRDLGVGVAAEGYSADDGYADDGYYDQPNYAYAGRPLYAYAPGYSVGPYYAPGFSVGIGIGPVGIGPAWGW